MRQCMSMSASCADGSRYLKSAVILKAWTVAGNLTSDVARMRPTPSIMIMIFDSEDLTRCRFAVRLRFDMKSK